MNGRDYWDGSFTLSQAALALHSVPAMTSPYAQSPVDITLFVSCLNNESTIVQTLETIIEAMDVIEKSFEILVIDDGSKDHSAEAVRQFIAQRSDMAVTLRINAQAKGLAQNYVDAAFIGCGTYFRLVQGDNSETVETLVDILRSVGDADIIIPYYIARLRHDKAQGFFARAGRVLMNIITGNQLNSYTSTHAHLRYNILRWHSDNRGTAFQMELLCRMLSLGFTHKQVPCRAGAGEKNSLSFKDRLSYIAVALKILF